MKKTIAILAALLATCQPLTTAAGNHDSQFQFKVRAGYNIGGTAPIGLPASIRSIDKYSLTPSFMVGADVNLPLQDSWGVQLGLHIENKGMDGEVTTKTYRMEIKKGESLLNGVYTGHVHQDVTEFMLTLPVMASCQLSKKLQLKVGPYFSLLLDKDFSGYVYDGYLRQGNPTGPMVSIGIREDERATYDFTDDMRRFQAGIALGVDWQVHRRLGLSADLNWGITGIHKSDFKTIEQTLFPIYGTIGVFYRIK
jgi:hypothetical protein